jgi:hypothetical protein
MAQEDVLHSIVSTPNTPKHRHIGFTQKVLSGRSQVVSALSAVGAEIVFPLLPSKWREKVPHQKYCIHANRPCGSHQEIK